MFILAKNNEPIDINEQVCEVQENVSKDKTRQWCQNGQTKGLYREEFGSK